MSIGHTPTEPTHRFPPDSCPRIDKVIEWHDKYLSNDVCRELEEELEAVRTINSDLRSLAGDWKEWAEYQYERATEAEKQRDRWESEHSSVQKELEALQRKYYQLDAEYADLKHRYDAIPST